jgi:hypothetical protein
VKSSKLRLKIESILRTCGTEKQGAGAHSVVNQARRRAIERKLCAVRLTPGTSANTGTYPKKLELQRAIALMLWDKEFDYMITLNSNDYRFNHERGRVAIKRFGALVDRCLLGGSWFKYPSRERTFFIAVPEYRGAEWHYHILLKVPRSAKRYPSRMKKLRRVIRTHIQTKRILPRGDADIKRLTGVSDIEDTGHQFEVACYVVKDLWKPGHWENCIFSTEFHPSGQRKRAFNKTLDKVN